MVANVESPPLVLTIGVLPGGAHTPPAPITTGYDVAVTGNDDSADAPPPDGPADVLNPPAPPPPPPAPDPGDPYPPPPPAATTR